MKTAIVLVTPPLLAQIMRLPEGTRITAAGMDDEGHITLTVEHEGLIDQPPGIIGTALPLYQESERQVNDVEFIEWGQR